MALHPDPSTPANTPPLRTEDPFDQRLELARKLADERRFGDAIVLFDWLCDAYPDRAAAVIDSANAYSRVYDYAGVAKRFAHIESRSPVPTDVWLAMADISHRLRRPQWALRYLKQATGKMPTADAFGQFALYLERANDLDQAMVQIEQGLKLDPQNQFCRLAKAKVLRRQKSFDAAITLLHELVKDAAQPRTQISAGYELAHCHDALGDCQSAIDALLSAKQLTANQDDFAMIQQRAAAAQQMHHRFLTALNADYFTAASNWKPAHEHRLALLGGHPRSGTTLLEQILDSHSDIVSAEETMIFANGVNDPFMRELHGQDFCQSALQIPADHLELFRWNYFLTTESLLDQPIAGKLLIDKNPSYTDLIPTFARVFPEATYIIALRDPRDVVLSCFFQDLPANEVTVHFQSLPETAMRYANTMAMWLVCRENMDQSKWIEVRYESLVKDLPTEAQRVMQKLNLPWQPAQSSPEVHARHRTVISPTYADVAQPVHPRAIGKWKRYEKHLAEAMPVLATFIEAFEYE